MMNAHDHHKRSQQLAPLSREHDDGMDFVHKLRAGLANRTATDTLRHYALWYWRHHIKPHFFHEERILIPYMDAGAPLATRLKDEHEHIRELILGLDAEADQRTLVLLCDLISQHIRFEEEEVFTELEKKLTPEKLDEISVQLQKHPMPAEAWKDEFWAN